MTVNESLFCKVALGGGRSIFLGRASKDPEYPNRSGTRVDGRNLMREWVNNKPDPSRAKYVWNEADFNKVDPDKTDYLLGLCLIGVDRRLKI